MYWKTPISYIGETLNEGGEVMEAITCAWALAYGGKSGLEEGLGRKLLHARKWQYLRSWWRHASVNGKENNQYTTKELNKRKQYNQLQEKKTCP